METLLENRVDRSRRSDNTPGLSLIAASMEIGQKTFNSILSVDRIADEIGRDYEIIVSVPQQEANENSILARVRREIGHVTLLHSHSNIPGTAKEEAFKLSRGKFVVPFSSDLVYPVEYADVLHGFLQMKTKRLFFSELPLVHRDLISEVGGWRPLSNGEDLDLYSRLAVNYGTLACPTNLMWKDNVTVSRVLGLRYPDEIGGISVSKRYCLARDLIIACNYSMNDVREFSQIKKSLDGRSSSILMLFAYMGSRISKVKPVTYNRNNLVVLMESVLESLVLKEYLKIPEMDDRVFLQIDRTHIEFLTRKSKLFRDMKASLAYFLRDQI